MGPLSWELGCLPWGPSDQISFCLWKHLRVASLSSPFCTRRPRSTKAPSCFHLCPPSQTQPKSTRRALNTSAVPRRDARLARKVKVLSDSAQAGRQCMRASQSLARQIQYLCPAAPCHTGVRESPTPASEGLPSHLRDEERAASPVAESGSVTCPRTMLQRQQTELHQHRWLIAQVRQLAGLPGRGGRAGQEGGGRNAFHKQTKWCSLGEHPEQLSNCSETHIMYDLPS